jgi:hypothetical protein
MVFLTIFLVLFSSVTFAEKERINWIKTENMINTIANIAMPHNCTMFKSCMQNCNMPPIRVTLETSGGFGGLTTTKTIDSDKLSTEQANKLSRLVNASNFFNLPATIAYSGPARDFFQYKLTIETKGKKHTVAVDEPVTPPELKPLIQWLRQNPAT